MFASSFEQDETLRPAIAISPIPTAMASNTSFYVDVMEAEPENLTVQSSDALNTAFYEKENSPNRNNMPSDDTSTFFQPPVRGQPSTSSAAPSDRPSSSTTSFLNLTYGSFRTFPSADDLNSADSIASRTRGRTSQTYNNPNQ